MPSNYQLGSSSPSREPRRRRPAAHSEPVAVSDAESEWLPSEMSWLPMPSGVDGARAARRRGVDAALSARRLSVLLRLSWLRWRLGAESARSDRRGAEGRRAALEHRAALEQLGELRRQRHSDVHLLCIEQRLADAIEMGSAAVAMRAWRSEAHLSRHEREWRWRATTLGARGAPPGVDAGRRNWLSLVLALWWMATRATVAQGHDRTAGTTRMLGLLLVTQHGLEGERLQLAWQTWRHWQAQQRTQKWHEQASDALSTRHVEQEEKFGRAMAAVTSVRGALVDAKLREEGLTCLGQAFGGMALHAARARAGREREREARARRGLSALSDLEGLWRRRLHAGVAALRQRSRWGGLRAAWAAWCRAAAEGSAEGQLRALAARCMELEGRLAAETTARERATSEEALKSNALEELHHRYTELQAFVGETTRECQVALTEARSLREQDSLQREEALAQARRDGQQEVLRRLAAAPGPDDTPSGADATPQGAAERTCGKKQAGDGTVDMANGDASTGMSLSPLSDLLTLAVEEGQRPLHFGGPCGEASLDIEHSWNGELSLSAGALGGASDTADPDSPGRDSPGSWGDASLPLCVAGDKADRHGLGLGLPVPSAEAFRRSETPDFSRPLCESPGLQGSDWAAEEPPCELGGQEELWSPAPQGASLRVAATAPMGGTALGSFTFIDGSPPQAATQAGRSSGRARAHVSVCGHARAPATGCPDVQRRSALPPLAKHPAASDDATADIDVDIDVILLNVCCLPQCQIRAHRRFL